MGKTFSTGLLTNGLWQDSSNNIGIGGAANASFKLQVTGATNLTGALTASTATFESSGSGNTFLINHTSGSGIALTITKGGNGEGLIINKTSGTGNALSVTGTTSLGGALSGTSATFSGAIKVLTAANGTNAINFGTASTNYHTITYDDSTGKLTFNTDSSRIVSFLNSNVGIGTSSPNDYNDGFGNRLVLANTSGSTGVTIVTSTGGNGNIYFADGTSGDQQYRGIIAYEHANDAMRFSTQATERMRISSDGNVGIGRTPNTWVSGNKALELVASSGLSADNTSMRVQANAYVNTSGNWIYGSNGEATFYTQGAGSHQWFTAPSGSAGGVVTFTERMRITSGGYFKASNNGTYISTTANSHEFNSNEENWIVENWNRNASPYGLRIRYPNTAPNNGTNSFIYADDNAALRFEVRSNGGIENFQANDVNLSDERTKKDILPLESYWDKFKAIEIVKFKYKDQTHDDFNIGVIAQQVESIAPEFIDVDGWGETPEDGIPLKSVYTADLHHATIKVLQEAMAKIEEQQAQIEELKGEIDILKAK
jgi:hypothetical protein